MDLVNAARDRGRPCRLRDPLQPRVAAARRGLRHAAHHRWPSRASPPACRTSSSSATSRPPATGAGRRTTCAAMQLMLRADVPHDYVLATGISHRLSFFLAKAFAAAGIDDWTAARRQHAAGAPAAGDTNILVGDSRAAYLELGWRHTVDFDSMAGHHGAARHGAARRPGRALADPVTDRKVSYAQNAEDVRVWRAFRDRPSQAGLTYVDVGANEPRHLSITASLSDLGWRGLLIEADPDLAERAARPPPRRHRRADGRGGRPGRAGLLPGAGHGAGHPRRGRGRGRACPRVRRRAGAGRHRQHRRDHAGAWPARRALHVRRRRGRGIHCPARTFAVHASDRGSSASRRSSPGTTTPSHQEWEPRILERDYRYVAFDGVNRWYVAGEHADLARGRRDPVQRRRRRRARLGARR